MFLVSSRTCLCTIHWTQVLNREWRCSWSSADRRCSNYIWVINNFIAYLKGATYIRGLKVHVITIYVTHIMEEWESWQGGLIVGGEDMTTTNKHVYYNVDYTLASCHLKSQVTWLFVQQLVQAEDKVNITVFRPPRHMLGCWGQRAGPIWNHILDS